MAKEEVIRFRGDFRTRWGTRYLFARLFLHRLTPRKVENFLAVERDARRRTLHPRSIPYVLKVETTNLCSNKCIFCYDGRRPPQPGERGWGTMSLTSFTEIINRFHTTTLSALLYGFGEPLLDPTLAQKIAITSRAGIASVIASNLLPPRQEIIRQVVDAGLDAVKLSCPGVSRLTYSKYTRTDRYQEVIANLEYLVDYRRKTGRGYPLLEWNFCYNNFNLNEVDQAQVIARRLKVDHFRISPMWAPPQKAGEWMPENIIEDYTRSADELTCSGHYREIMVNWDGSLRPCCRNERLLKNDLGNIADFDRFWQGEIYQYIRKLTAGRCVAERSRHTPCNDCEIITGRKAAEW